MSIACAPRVELHALPGVPLVHPGDDLPALFLAALERAGLELQHHDVLVVPSKVVSRAEGRYVDLASVVVSPRAEELARATAKDPRFVELVLRECTAVSRTGRDLLVVRHRLGFVCANAGIDLSNARPPGAREGSGPWAVLLPEAPDRSADRLRAALAARSGKTLAVLVSDSFGRPFRLGTVGACIGLAGIPPLWDQRGGVDLHGRVLEHTLTALADQLAAAADLVAGQAAEGRAAVLVRGIHFPPGDHSARSLDRLPQQDVYA